MGTALAQPKMVGEFEVLGKTLWVIFTQSAEGAKPDNKAMKAHMTHQMQLEKDGIMFGAGPLWDAQGNRAGGMIIIRAESQDEATRIADSDPMHASGLRTYTLKRWMLNEGHIRVSLDYSKGTFELE
jgi:uncharacterized protein YciI